MLMSVTASQELLSDTAFTVDRALGLFQQHEAFSYLNVTCMDLGKLYKLRILLEMFQQQYCCKQVLVA